jgi:hypothetical protein
MWVRKDGAFEGIVDADFFDAAQRIIQARSARFSDEELLARLSQLLESKGFLSGLIIDEVDEMPSTSVYRKRFGSLLRAYQLVGYSPSRDFRYIETNRALRAMHPDVVASVVEGLRAAGGHADVDENGLLKINAEFSASIIIARCLETPAGGLRWKLRLDQGLRPNLTIAVRMEPGNTEIRDYYLLPWIEYGADPSLRLAPDNGLLLDTFRFDNLEAFYDLARRTELAAA